jgi:hypothetical protein
VNSRRNWHNSDQNLEGEYFAESAYRRVPRVSSKLISAGEIAAIMEVMEFPPRDETN